MQNDNNQFNPISELKESWNIFTDNWLTLCLVYFLRCWIPLLAACITFAIFIDFRGWNLVAAAIAGLVTTSFLMVPYLQFFKSISQRKHASRSNIRIDFKKGLYLFCTIIFTSLAVASGFALLVIPGVIIAIRLSLSWLCVIDDKTPLDSIITSFELTEGLFFPILLILVFAGLLYYFSSVFFLAFELVFTIFFYRFYSSRSSVIKK